MEISRVTSANPYLATDPDAEPVDSRFPASMNALISGMTPAERDEFFEIYEPYGPTNAEREARQEEFDRAAYDRYLDERTSGAPVPVPFETWVDARDQRIEQDRLENFRARTGNPNATAEDMYAAGEAHQADLVQEELELLQETDPDATLVDVGRERLERRAQRQSNRAERMMGSVAGPPSSSSSDESAHDRGSSNDSTEPRPVRPGGGHLAY